MATGNHLLVPVKANQSTLLQHLTETYLAQPPQDRHHTHEIGRHHRIERRLTQTWYLPLEVGTEDWHAHFCTLVEIQRHTDVFDTRQKDWVSRQETAYYVSTATLSAAHAAHAVRAHWGIENRLHNDDQPSKFAGRCQVLRNRSLVAVARRGPLSALRRGRDHDAGA